MGSIGLALVISSHAASPPDLKTKPWKGERQTIPGKITAAFYDEGGEGVAFHDTDAKNNGSGSLNRGPEEKDNFRKDEAVDISYTKPAFDKFTDGTALEADKYYVGWIAPEEWVNYSVDVKTAGTYQINLLSTAAKEAAEISLSVDGVDSTGAIVLKTTGHVHTWRMNTNLAEIKLAKGPHVLTLKFAKEGLMNVQYLEFVPKSAGAASSYNGKPTATGHDRRIDVVWAQSDTPGVNGWNIWRASQASGPFERLNARPQNHTVCSDFLGSNGARFFYRVSGVSGGNEVSTSAVELASGEPQWQWDGDGPASSSPGVMTVGGKKQLVTSTAKNLVGLDLAKGKPLWQVPFEATQGNNTTPVVDGSRVIYTGQGKGLFAGEIESQGEGYTATPLWTNKQVGARFTTPVLRVFPPT